MKNLFKICLLLLLFSTAITAQWKTGEYKSTKAEERGYYTYLTCNGYYSTDKVKEVASLFQLVQDENSYVIYVYENEKDIPTHHKNTRTDIQIIDPLGNIQFIRNVVFRKEGFVYFTGDTYEALDKILMMPGSFTMIFHRTDYITKKQYKMWFTNRV